MGLDMYLNKETYIGNNYRNSDNMVTILFPKNDPIKNQINQEKIICIVEEVAYWRKANYVHSWFVHNVQDDEDDCGRYLVSIDKLKELVNLCKLILKNPKLAPTQSGFFFRDAEYYLQDLKDTIEMLEPHINNGIQGDFYYESRW